MNGKNRILKKLILALPAVILGTYAISMIWSGCRLGDKLSTSIRKEPAQELESSQRESDVVRHTFPSPYQEPNKTPIPTDQSTQPQKIRAKTDTTVYPLIVTANQNKPLALVAVPENDGCLLVAAAPIAAKIRQLNKTPVLLALASKPIPEQTSLLKRLEPFLGSCTIIAPDPNLYVRQIRGNYLKNTVQTTSEPARTGLRLAKSFWGKSDRVVIAATADSEAMILGSTLASHLVVPFISITGDEDSKLFSQELKALNANRIYFVTSEHGLTSINIPEQEIEILDTPTVQQRLVNILGSSNIRNIILFRVPDEFTESGASSWLAPYMSLM